MRLVDGIGAQALTEAQVDRHVCGAHPSWYEHVAAAAEGRTGWLLVDCWMRTLSATDATTSIGEKVAFEAESMGLGAWLR
jgi:hypothetical protein